MAKIANFYEVLGSETILSPEEMKPLYIRKRNELEREAGSGNANSERLLYLLDEWYESISCSWRKRRDYNRFVMKKFYPHRQ